MSWDMYLIFSDKSEYVWIYLNSGLRYSSIIWEILAHLKIKFFFKIKGLFLNRNRFVKLIKKFTFIYLFLKKLFYLYAVNTLGNTYKKPKILSKGLSRIWIKLYSNCYKLNEYKVLIFLIKKGIFFYIFLIQRY